MPTTEPDLNITFLDSIQPKATAAVYTVRAEHTLTDDGVPVDGTGNDKLPIAEQRFEIRAARFVLDESSVHAFYPAEGASGAYGSVLPHITLNRPHLPWERELLATRADLGRPPWLALLVFGEGEIPDDPEATGQSTTRTVAELRRPGTGILGPALSDQGIDPTVEASRCQTIDVPADLFTAVVPRENELHYLAHVRDVVTAQQLRDDGEILTEGEYAVLAANRFPRDEGAHAAHLVSLEGFIGRLGPGQLDGYNAVRLCVLRSWGFTNNPAGHLDAASLLTELVRPGRADPENLALRLYPPSARAAADPGVADAAAVQYTRDRLGRGYAAVPYRVLSGESTYGWYRGPFTPVTAPDVPAIVELEPESGQAAKAYTTADHALIYEPEHGLFDVSYAAAWTLGRTLALSDPDYSAEVTRARRELANKAVRMMAMGSDAGLSSADPEAVDGQTLRELAAPGFGRSLCEALAAPLVPEAEAAPASRRSRLSRATARGLLADSRRQSVLRSTADLRTQDVPHWIDELALLNNVPFCYLVPHPGMLPAESLRMFRIDQGWIRALINGALDVGVHTSLDADVDSVLTASVAGARTTVDPVAGLLIRSDLVPAWPVFDLVATKDDEPVNELRRDHPAPDTVLILFDDVPDEIVIREPGQGIHFGLSRTAKLNPRDLTPGKNLGFSLGYDFPATGDIFTRFLRGARPGATADVLNLRDGGGLVGALATDLGQTDLSPGAFALQLIQAPIEQRITTPDRMDAEESA
ncbi:hypothetical protein ABH920_001389 [Catenulispora sp. EB89]|uniref:hypothetical protein n=1 Tax=Catenulispora sp. EB89 TaxID=3156257 RepID=UPI003518B522